MLSPIRVIPKSKTTKLDPMSRINYSKIYTVEHNVKVYDFGDVDEDYHERLLEQWKKVLFYDQKAQPSPEPQTSAAQPIGQAQLTGHQVSYPTATTYSSSGLTAPTMADYYQQSTATAPAYTQAQYTVSYRASAQSQSSEDDSDE
jgi:hypothetical protein